LTPHGESIQIRSIMAAKFIDPKPPKLNLRRAMRRAAQDSLRLQFARRTGIDVSKVQILRETGGRFFALVGGRERIELRPEEEKALAAAHAWEKTGVGEGPIIPRYTI